MSTTLDTLIAAMAHGRAELFAVLDAADPALLDRKGLIGEWSVKNALAHLAGWEAWMRAFLPYRIAGEEVPEPWRSALDDEDGWNARETAARESLTPAAQRAELEHLDADLIAYMRSLDRDIWDREQPWPHARRPLPEFFRLIRLDHEAEHLAEIREALSRAQ